MADREAIIREREFIKRNGSADMVDGYVPERPQSVTTKQFVDEQIIEVEEFAVAMAIALG